MNLFAAMKYIIAPGDAYKRLKLFYSNACRVSC